MHVTSQRIRWLIGLVVASLVISLAIKPLMQPSAPEVGVASSIQPSINWEQLSEALVDVPEGLSDSEGLLQVGGYVTNLSDIDLLENRYSIQFFLWSIWSGPPELNPSDSLEVLNGIYDGDIQRFERVRK